MDLCKNEQESLWIWINANQTSFIIKLLTPSIDETSDHSSITITATLFSRRGHVTKLSFH